MIGDVCLCSLATFDVNCKEHAQIQKFMWEAVQLRLTMLLLVFLGGWGGGGVREERIQIALKEGHNRPARAKH